LPKKRYIKSSEAAAEERIVILEAYLREIMMLKPFWACTDLLLFIDDSSAGLSPPFSNPSTVLNTFSTSKSRSKSNSSQKNVTDIVLDLLQESVLEKNRLEREGSSRRNSNASCENKSSSSSGDSNSTSSYRSNRNNRNNNTSLRNTLRSTAEAAGYKPDCALSAVSFAILLLLLERYRENLIFLILLLHIAFR
jgi:hypothetical protein